MNFLAEETAVMGSFLKNLKRAMIKILTPTSIFILANWSEAKIHGVNSIPLQFYFNVKTMK
jgi:hypothetical protein